MLLDKFLNTLLGLGPENVQLKENKLNCLVVKLQRLKVLIFSLDYFFQLFLNFVFSSETTQVAQGLTYSWEQVYVSLDTKGKGPQGKTTGSTGGGDNLGMDLLECAYELSTFHSLCSLNNP